jgi:ribokinase
VVARETEECGRTVPGGKGANQAVGCACLGAPAAFVCQLGADANGLMLEAALVANGVDISLCGRSSRPSGLGLVFLQGEGGGGSCVVVGGSNAAWPESFDAGACLRENTAVVMLQMEVPQHVNELMAAAACERGVPVFQDLGGAERMVTNEHLSQCMYVSPNETELSRLTGLPVGNEEEIIAASRSLQKRGARNVLVTLGSKVHNP